MAETLYDPNANAKVMLATCSYDNPDASYTFSIQQSRLALHKAGIDTAYLLLRGGPHVDDARNEIVRDFLASNCTELVFLDADVSWRPEQLIRLLSHDVDLVGGVYPHRYRQRDAMPLRGVPTGTPNANGLLAVEGLPTGFMRIKRKVFDWLKPHVQHYGDTHIFFERTLIDGTRWGGDLNFCNLWRKHAGRVYADIDLRLAHAGTEIFHDSLGAWLRRRENQTLQHVAAKVAAGASTLDDYNEARDYIDNHWGAQVDVLAAAIGLARKADKPIIEAGSGLSTVLMAAATEQTVFCLEHDPLHAQKLRDMATLTGAKNIALCLQPIIDGWYDMSDLDLPEHFSLGLCDGPPRLTGSRLPFFDNFNCDTLVIDDADDASYRAALEARFANRQVNFIEPRCLVVQ